MEIGKVVSAKITLISSHGLELSHGKENIHVSLLELSWFTFGLMNRINLMFKVDEKVDVKIISFSDGRYYGSIKRINPEKNPWFTSNLYSVGDEVLGSILKLTDFGFFIKLPSGAIATCECLREHCDFEVGDKVEVRIGSVDVERERVGVSVIL